MQHLPSVNPTAVNGQIKIINDCYESIHHLIISHLSKVLNRYETCISYLINPAYSYGCWSSGLTKPAAAWPSPDAGPFNENASWARREV